jgi:hypothetical protein
LNSKTFCLLLGKRVGISRDMAHKVLAEAIKLGMEIIKEGDFWRLPGLGKIYCLKVPPSRYLDRFKLAEGKEVWHDLPARKRIKCRFTPYASATLAINKPVSEDLITRVDVETDLDSEDDVYEKEDLDT